MSRKWWIHCLPVGAVLMFLSAGWLWVSSSCAQETPVDPLAQLDCWAGKTWRGELAGHTPESPLVDIARWERVLNGQAVRVLHSVNEGQYGGETIYVWDPERKSIVYHYFTTAGFFTEGAATFEGNRMLTHETLRGNAGGITEVRSTAEFLPDGRVRVVAEYLKAGAWTTGHQAVYAPDSAAVVVLH